MWIPTALQRSKLWLEDLEFKTILAVLRFPFGIHPAPTGIRNSTAASLHTFIAAFGLAEPRHDRGLTSSEWRSAAQLHEFETPPCAIKLASTTPIFSSLIIRRTYCTILSGTTSDALCLLCSGVARCCRCSHRVRVAYGRSPKVQLELYASCIPKRSDWLRC